MYFIPIFSYFIMKWNLIKTIYILEINIVIRDLRIIKIILGFSIFNTIINNYIVFEVELINCHVKFLNLDFIDFFRLLKFKSTFFSSYDCESKHWSQEVRIFHRVHLVSIFRFTNGQNMN